VDASTLPLQITQRESSSARLCATEYRYRQYYQSSIRSASVKARQNTRVCHACFHRLRVSLNRVYVYSSVHAELCAAVLYSDTNGGDSNDSDIALRASIPRSSEHICRVRAQGGTHGGMSRKVDLATIMRTSSLRLAACVALGYAVASISGTSEHSAGLLLTVLVLGLVFWVRRSFTTLHRARDRALGPMGALSVARAGRAVVSTHLAAHLSRLHADRSG
jgi:hypothetical protein